MVRREFAKETYTEISKTYKRNGVQFYLLRVDPQDVDENTVIAVEEVYDHRPTKADKDALYNAWLGMEKNVKLQEITEYDVSDNVNVFEFEGVTTWLNKETRVGLVNSITIEKTAHKETTTLYLNDVAYTIPVDVALSMLSELELYAIGCYRTTEEHKAAVLAETVIENVTNFDITADYPPHPVFTLNN